MQIKLYHLLDILEVMKNDDNPSIADKSKALADELSNVIESGELSSFDPIIEFE